jgi:hypothetical protein
MLFLSAIALSSVAAYYSIMGLVAIFSGAVTSIAVMGGVLEVSKLVVTSWLYRNWKETPRLLKAYFITAIVVLMLITSMGIFGYLSKAHLEQGMSSGNASAEVALLDEKIIIQKENINAARKTLSQLDSQVDATLSRSTDTAGAVSSSSIRRGQAKERTRLIEEIGTSQKEVARLNEERAPKASELRKVEAEVGPIKYIAALIYDDSQDTNTLEKAVRVIILMLVFVFDPLAVLMFIAVNQSMKPKTLETPAVVVRGGDIHLSFDDSVDTSVDVDAMKYDENTRVEHKVYLNNNIVQDLRPVVQ